MKFYDRDNELSLLKRAVGTASLKFIVVKGIRRIGKTELLLTHLKNKEFAYVFVPKGKTTNLFLEDVSTELKIPVFSRAQDFLDFVFDKYEFVFLDEFQNFYFMDSSIYSEMQRLIDKYSKKALTIFVAGSSYSLLKKIFSDYGKALYGRRDFELSLQELPVSTVCEILNDLHIKDIEDQVKFWAVFGGVPRFYTILEKLKVTSFHDFEKTFLKEQLRVLFDEGRTILVSEFGGDYKIFYSLLEAIALGRTTLSEISALFGSDKITTNRYLNTLRNEYNFVFKQTPVTEPLKSSNGRYRLRNNFISFWFKFFKKQEAFFEQERFSELLEIISKNLNTFFGRLFEDFCMGLVKENKIRLPFAFTAIGKQWGKIPKEFKTEKQESTFEIDFVVLNNETKQILFAECKWKEKVDAKKIAKGLINKTRFVRWFNDERKEFFAVFAKSFNKKITEVDGRKVYCYDLKDLKKVLRK
ncbi:MAG: ATP-binding protein [archaeon]